MKKVLLDCAPGVSDALALLLLSRSSELQLTAITTGYGRCSAETACKNAQSLAELLHLSVPVAYGAERPLFAERLPEEQADSLAAISLPTSAARPIQWSWDEIYRQAKAAGKLTLLTMGPLTNVAIALFRYEDLPQYLENIVILGGSAGSGDATEFGEFNAASDPHAFEVVLRSGVPIRMLGLDALETARLNEEECQQMLDMLPAPFSTMLQAQCCELRKWGEIGITLPGAALVAITEQPQFAESCSRFVRVETVRSGMFGRTVVDIRRHSKEPHNADVITSVRKEALWSWLCAKSGAN